MYKNFHWDCVYIRLKIFKNQKQSKYPPTMDSLSQLWFIHLMEYYEAIKSKIYIVDMEK